MDRDASAKDTLGDFEDETEASGDDSDDDLHWGGDWFGVFLVGGMDATFKHFANRKPGGLSAPLLRLESGYQNLYDADVDGYMIRSEIVWGSFGVGGEFLRYHEDNPKQNFEFGTFETLFRIAPNEYFQFSIANGVRFLEGRNKKSAYQGGVTLGIYPYSWWGLEFDLRLADIGKHGLGDYRVGGLLRIPQFRFVALRFGYRVIEVGDSVLEGGEIGAVVTW
jgi:hypothetical protein